MKGGEDTTSNNLQYAGVGSLDNKDFKLLNVDQLGMVPDTGSSTLWSPNQQTEVSIVMLVGSNLTASIITI